VLYARASCAVFCVIMRSDDTNRTSRNVPRRQAQLRQPSRQWFSVTTIYSVLMFVLWPLPS